jgi:C4-dicarboxylate-specific signal transduction histidine kinase
VNLVQNAYQAMLAEPADRERVLRISAAKDSSQGREGVSVLLEDTGAGVPVALREQIFNPFYTTKRDGVGMGLAIVAKIVDDHRGWIRLDDNPSGGAKFHVFLPAAAEGLSALPAAVNSQAGVNKR